jgi:hypothetical protein
MFLGYASYVNYRAMRPLGRGSAEERPSLFSKGMATENERCFCDHVRRTTGEGKGRGKLPAGQDRHPEAENGLLMEVG